MPQKHRSSADRKLCNSHDRSNRMLHILVVDQGGALLDQLTALAGDAALYRFESVTVEEAYASLQQRRGDLLLVDDQAGECTGIALLHRCATELAMVVPLIYCTNSIDKEMIDAAFAAGATDVLRLKGMSADLFGRSLCYALEQVRQRLRTNSMLRTIIDLVPGMIYVKDRDGRFLLANQATAEFYGTSVSQIIGTNQAYWHRDVDEFALFQEQDRKVIDHHEHIEGMIDQLTTPDGVCHILETSKIPLSFFDGNVPAVLGISRDITENRRLQKAQTMVMAALDAAADAVVITALDGTIEYVNLAFERMTGYSAAEAIGQTPRILKSGHQDTAFYREMWKILLAGETFRAVITNRRKDGLLFEAEETITPVYDEHNHMVAFVAVERDVTEKKKAEQALRSSEERFSLAAEGSNDGLWDWDIVNDQVYVSPRVYAMVGRDETSGAIRTAADFFDLLAAADGQSGLLKRINRHLNGLTEYFSHECKISSEDGKKIRWLQARGIARRDEAGHAIRMAGSLTDITVFKQSEKELVEQSLRDPLTGLANRKMFMNHLTSAIHASDVHGDYQAAVLYIGINRMKELRTSMGDTLGDRLISKVARRIRDCTRPSDVFAYVHSGEFAMLLPKVQSQHAAEIMATRIDKAMGRPFRESAQQIKVSTSIGITMIDHSSSRVPEYVLRDAALAQSEARKRSQQYSLFDQRMHDAALQRIQLESELDDAIAGHQFQLYLQPIMDLQHEVIAGFEALIRWMHHDRGMISPAEFIPVAEETGQIIEIGKWVLRQAFQQLCKWHGMGGVRSDLYISINLSPLQLADEATLQLIYQLLEQAPFPPSHLRIEITESAILEDAEYTRSLLGKLHECGSRLYLDDFGTGYSSLSYLHSFPFDVLKVDQSFTFKIDSDPATRKITESIIQLGTHLGMKVVAEGVETEAHRNVLIGMGCHYGQGYLFSKPLPPEQAETFIDTSRLHVAGQGYADKP
ncbi:EAL domain-containing protein [Mariprofundus erugo]|nr:EAL domain-containing protein [Mariprofundus erugo]